MKPKTEREAFKTRNKYADKSGILTFNPNQTTEENSGIWFKPFASFEKVNLDGGPNVGNNTYGALIGFYSKMYELSNGWNAIYSGFIGYNGSRQYYEGNSIYQNGGQIGLTGVWYKNIFLQD